MFIIISVDKYRAITSESVQQTQTNVPKMVSSNPLDSLDCK